MPTKYSFPTAFSDWSFQEKAAIDRVVASGNYTMGAEVEGFEGEFAASHGMKHAIMVNSGSSANLLAVAALFHVKRNPLKRGDKAIVPAMAWATTYAPLVQHGLGLLVADCDETWNAAAPWGALDFLEGWEDARLVVGCSILGNPMHHEFWGQLAKANGAMFLEDNCESIGASVDGKLCGTFGLMNTFSFFYSHQLSAIEGGMILTDDDECAILCRMLRDHGMTRSLGKIDKFEDEYNFRYFGYNLRPLEMHAAVARVQLARLSRFIEARNKNRDYFIQRCEHVGIPIRFQKKNGTIQSPFGIAFSCENAEKRGRLVDAFRARGIDCRLPCGGSFTQHHYGEPWASQKTPVADRIHQTAMFIGCPPHNGSMWWYERAIEIMRDVL
jgi:CDP-6-deoxy-D-xylo-4-hexulose-3-dehydrase